MSAKRKQAADRPDDWGIVTSEAAVADWFGVSVKLPGIWIREHGCPRIGEGGVYRYDLREIARWYVRYKTGHAERQDVTEAKRRKAVADAEIAELRLAQMRGELVAQKEVEDDIARAANTLAEQLSGMVAGVVPMLAGKTQVEMHRVLSIAVNRFLNEFAERAKGGRGAEA